MKDDTCLVPCSGLYADISDDVLKQTVIEGSKRCYFRNQLNLVNSGFRALTEGQNLQSTGRLHHLQQMVSTSTERKEAEEYIQYKESYVKQLRFDPEKQNLSRLLQTRENLTHFHILCFSCSDTAHLGVFNILIRHINYWKRTLSRGGMYCDRTVTLKSKRGG